MNNAKTKRVTLLSTISITRVEITIKMENTARMETTVSNHVVIDRISWYKLLQYRKEVCRILGVCLLPYLLHNW